MRFSFVYVVSALLVAPLVIALTAFFSGLWQHTAEPPLLNEEELGI